MMNTTLIIGIEMRSGTNYLYDLLGKHEHCHLATDSAEDFLVSESAYLRKYASIMWKFWQKFSPKRVSYDIITSKFEQALHEILAAQVEITGEGTGMVISKTPCTIGLKELPVLFKNTKVVFLVRDGRSVAYSLEKSFDVGFFKSLSRYQQGARNIVEFMTNNRDYFDKNCLLVRYEDLFSSPEAELRRVFDFLGVSAQSYDYEAGARSPVIGSSDLRDTKDKIEWSPSERASDFKPLRRFENWPKWKQLAANLILRDELKRFDYLEQEPKRNFSSILIKFTYRLFIAGTYLSTKRIKGALKKKLLR